VKLGRIAGIPISISWSWLVIFALIVWTLAAGVFPSSTPHRSAATYAVMGVVAALILFLSLLLHELGHAIQARRDGVQIEGIRLWLFGGIAEMRSGFPSPGAEFRIAGAGPAVSLLLGLCFLALGSPSGLPRVAAAILTWLGVVNLTLLVFNLLPSLPLDGGRLLHALLWRMRGDTDAATVAAASVARVIAIVLAAIGLLSFVSAGAVAGLWLAAIAWFLLAAASAEAGRARTHHALGDLHIGDLMLTQPVMIDGDSTLAEFVDTTAAAGHYSTYPVVRDGHVSGLFPFREIARTPRNAWPTTYVRDVAIPYDSVPQLTRETAATDALDKLMASTVKRAFVVSDGQVIGFVSITDLARLIADPPPTRAVPLAS
jgi:Zn-dependent protease/predicted transcriptional regulator